MAVTTLGSFSGANDTDRTKRIPAAISALNKALAGDMQALSYMRGQLVGSATAVGKEAFRRALAIYDAQKPAAAPPSTATPPVGLVPIPRPPVLIDPIPFGGRIPESAPDPFRPPDIGGMTVPVSQPKPIGFDNAHPPLTHAPGGTVTVTGMKPGQVKPVLIGSEDGGVITSAPIAPEYGGPPSAPQAPANFGYVPPAPGGAALTAATTGAAPVAPAVSNSKVLLILGAGVLLWLLVGDKRK